MKIFIFLLFLTTVTGVSAESSPFKVDPLVSVIIDGNDHKHVFETLETAIALSKKVKVRNVVLAVSADKLTDLSATFAASENGEQDQKFRDQRGKILSANYTKYFGQLGLAGSEITSDKSIISRLNLSYSPTWIVRHQGKDYVFEGFPTISRYFTRDGEFNY